MKLAWVTSVSYSDIVATIALMVSIIAVPASGYLSYHFAIRGERRKEWNLLAVPMRERLIAQIGALNLGKYAHAEITRADILKFADLQKSNNAALIKAFEEFEKSHSREELWQSAPGRRYVVGDTKRALAASMNLLSLINRK